MKHIDFLNLPVFTQSNQSLGKISSFEIDPDSQSILRYYVKPRKLIEAFLAKQLIIHRSQVISLDKKRMIVEDVVSQGKIKVEGLAPGKRTTEMSV